MSDAAVTTVVLGLVQTVATIATFLTLWVKLRYGVEKAEEVSAKATTIRAKLDDNTRITTEAKEAASSMAGHSEACGEQMGRMAAMHAAHDARITALEVNLAAMRGTVEAAGKSIDSTRHEMRSHMQTMVNKLDLLMIRGGTPPAEPK